MKDSSQRLKVLKKILETENFEHLDVFHDSDQWDGMPVQERELLGLLYVMQGERQLSKGDNKVLDSFKRANLVAPDCSRIMYRQAVAFTRESHNAYCLKAARKIFYRVVALEPDFFDAWHDLAKTCTALAVISCKESDFTEAHKNFSKADEMVSTRPRENQAMFYKDWGGFWFHYGKYSGEAVDFKNAAKFYKRAVSIGMKTHSLWNDYANCLTELSALLKKPELLLKSVNMYWRSVRLKEDFFEGWMNLAAALKVIYEIHPLEAYYKLANEGFEQAAKLDPQNVSLWAKWGQLQVFHGKTFKSPEALNDSIKKFEAANICEPNHPVVLYSWAESLLCIGEWTEELQYLREAEAKIIKSLELQKDQPLIWHLYGNCLTELGRYFDDTSFFRQAIAKYRVGLRLAPQNSSIRHSMAIVYLSLSQATQDLQWLQKADGCCRDAIEKGGYGQAQYWNDWGVVLMKLGMATDDKDIVGSALSRFEQALRIRSQSQKHVELESEWLYNYGCALDFLGDFNDDLSMLEKAIHVLKKVIGLDPGFHHAYYNLAIALAHFGDLTADPDVFAESLKYLEAYLNLEPEDEYAWSEWGLTLIDLSQLIDDPMRRDDIEKLLGEAEVKFLHAGALGCQGALYHLACLHSIKKNYEGALHYLQLAKETNVLPPTEEIISNQWLEPIRYTPEFQRMILER